MIRWSMLLIWTCLIFLFTCTTNLEQLLNQGIISFQWTIKPNLSQFWYPLPSGFDQAFITQKMGHALSFFILTLLVYNLFLSLKTMFIFSLTIAVTTEVLQLYFYRGGRLFDIGIDSIGIISAMLFVIIALILSHEKSLTRRRSQT